MSLLRIIHLDDNKLDAERIDKVLRHDGMDVEIALAGSRTEFLNALSRPANLILSANRVNGYDALKVFEDARQAQPLIPIIIVTTEVGDERTAQLMRCGAVDLVLKSNLTALVPAVRRALKQAEVKGQHDRLAGDLRTTQERYRALIRNSSEAIWRFELDEPVPIDIPEDQQIDLYYRHAFLAEANEAMARMYGYETVKEMLGRRIDDFMPRSDSRNIEFLRQFIRHGYRLVDVESHDLTATGQTLYALNSLVGVIEEGKIVRAWGTNRDITQKHLAEAELARYRMHLEDMVRERTRELEETHQRLSLSERLVSMGTLSAGLGHDMGNLLLPVRCRLDAMEANPASAAFREDLHAIRKSADYLQRLSTGLRLLALDLNDSAADLEVTELTSWWQDAVTVLKNAVPRGVMVEHDFAQDLLPVRLSRAALTQVIFNLVQNAGDALRGRSNGRVVVWAKRAGDASDATQRNGEGPRMLIGVRDNGTGMRPDVRRRCLEPFFTTKTRGISTGMGLALVHGIVQKAMGSMEVQSQQGAGTNIILSLPATTAPVVEVQPGENPRQRQPLCVVQLRNARMSAFATSLLESLGFDVERERNNGGNGHGDPDSRLNGQHAAPSNAYLWLVDADRIPFAQAAAYLGQSPDRWLVMLGELPMESRLEVEDDWPEQLMHIREPGNFAGLREALRRIANSQNISSGNRLKSQGVEARAGFSSSH